MVSKSFLSSPFEWDALKNSKGFIAAAPIAVVKFC
eukprot:CAMPEP_0185915630 /NCGR_PEP_ID=MMETSP0924C-20121207/2604_1 /TAXON_ID=321610 /ORGANISM="Perkinsus chesapeaki, Strain ATCC PRA-65" /LENGTH=34 /DNA_ID= /DNA_START= /DNA_END= /DNA_ORIENTATION=